MEPKVKALQDRSRRFAIQVVKCVRTLPWNREGRLVSDQLLRAATAVAANYRAACRARSRAEFIAKIGVVVEEADESVFWLELLVDIGLAGADHIGPLIREAGELLAIFAASQRTAKRGIGH